MGCRGDPAASACALGAGGIPGLRLFGPQRKARLKGSILRKIRLSDFYGPETLKIINEVYDDLLHLTVADRNAVGISEDLAMRQRLAEILLTLHSEGQTNPFVLQRSALKRFREPQKRS